MPAHPAVPAEELLTSRTSVLHSLAIFWAYSAVAGSAAVVLGEAVAVALSNIVPVAFTRFLAATALVVGAGAVQESVFIRLAWLSRRKG